MIMQTTDKLDDLIRRAYYTASRCNDYTWDATRMVTADTEQYDELRDDMAAARNLIHELREALERERYLRERAEKAVAGASTYDPPGGFYMLSLKWSRGSDHFVWYRPKACGYTTDLFLAGVYSAEEARSHECEDVIAVPCMVAWGKSRWVRMISAEHSFVEEFKTSRRDKEPTNAE